MHIEALEKLLGKHVVWGLSACVRAGRADRVTFDRQQALHRVTRLLYGY